MIEINRLQIITIKLAEAKDILNWAKGKWGFPSKKNDIFSPITKLENGTYSFNVTQDLPIGEIEEEEYLKEKVRNGTCRMVVSVINAKGNTDHHISVAAQNIKTEPSANKSSADKKSSTKVIVKDFPAICRELTVKIVLATGLDSPSYLPTGNHFKIIELALPYINTTQDQDTVINFLTLLRNRVAGAHEAHVKIRILDAIVSADPALFFPFCRKPLLHPDNAETTYRNLCRELNRRVPKRQQKRL